MILRLVFLKDQQKHHIKNKPPSAALEGIIMAITKSKLIKWLGKKRMAMVEDIDISDGVIDIMLYENFNSVLYDESIWVFDIELNHEYTECDIKYDLLNWFSGVEDVSK